VFECGGTHIEVICSLEGRRLTVDLDGAALDHVRVWGADTEGLDLEADGVRRRYALHQVGDTVYVDSALGASALRELERFPTTLAGVSAGSLFSPMPGVVVQVLVAAGDVVQAGDTLITLEAMKMQHPVRAPDDGVVVEVRVREGEQVETASLLVVVEPVEEAG
jgi:biotin carboxyl carrier protein